MYRLYDITDGEYGRGTRTQRKQNNAVENFKTGTSKELVGIFNLILRSGTRGPGYVICDVYAYAIMPCSADICTYVHSDQTT